MSPSNFSPGTNHADGDSAYRRARECLAAHDINGNAHWLEQAAARDHPSALTELAILHLHGLGREANPAQAVGLLQRAEESGGAPGTAYLLAHIAMGNAALPRDAGRIDAWIGESARRGYPAALRVAALAFARSKDFAMQRAAVTCLQRATTVRDPVSAALLADRLHAGHGVACNVEEARSLANDLRAIGIPVGLPAAIETSETWREHADPDSEPCWDALRLLSTESPEFRRMCDSPEVAVCDEFLSDEECRYLIYSGARYLKQSQVIHPVTGELLEYEVRTSQDMAFIPSLDDIGVHVLQLRMAEAAGFDLHHCEPLTLLRYREGDQYRPHRDYFFPSSPSLAAPGGQRHSTVCTYLNAVQEGGETVFPDKGVTVHPSPGRAVMFRSLHADGTPNPHSLHAGLPVRTGEKWLASCWIRVNSLRPF